MKSYVVLCCIGLLVMGTGCRDASTTSSEAVEEPQGQKEQAPGVEASLVDDSAPAAKEEPIPSAEVKLDPVVPPEQKKEAPKPVKEAEKPEAEVKAEGSVDLVEAKEKSSSDTREEKTVAKVPDPTQIDDLKKKPKGPDGVKEDKEKVNFLPGFPPKHDKGHLPVGVGESILDPRIAPDADADFDAMRVPLGTSSDAGGSGLATIPSALSFHLGAPGPGNHQRVRAEATEPLEIISVQLMDKSGSFEVQNPPELPYLMALGDAVFITVGSKGGSGPEETTLQIQTDKGTKKIPVRYAKSKP